MLQNSKGNTIHTSNTNHDSKTIEGEKIGNSESALVFNVDHYTERDNFGKNTMMGNNDNAARFQSMAHQPLQGSHF